jgi:type II secretory pathway pseudopilin PulG
MFSLNSKKSAFSLIELSVILTVIAVVITNAINISKVSSKNNQVRDTKEKLKKIETAINVYVKKYEKLPCPASLILTPRDADYGKSVGADADCDYMDNYSGDTYVASANNNGIYKNTAEQIIQGALPAVTLGLGRDFVSDAFGNKFSYRVTKQATANSGYRYFKMIDMGQSARKIRIRHQKEGNVGPNYRTIQEEGIYAVISHGENGFGAFDINSNNVDNRRAPVANVQHAEIRNVVNGNKLIPVVVTISDVDPNFDDIVLYKTRDQIISETGCCSP